jgi:hypothetical protein
MDTRAGRGTCGVLCIVWDTAEVEGSARGSTEVSKSGDEGTTKGLVVGPPGVVVILLAFVSGAVRLPRLMVGLIASIPGAV